MRRWSLNLNEAKRRHKCWYYDNGMDDTCAQLWFIIIPLRWSLWCKVRCAVVSLPLVIVFAEILLNSVLTDEAFACVCHHLHLTLFNLVKFIGSINRGYVRHNTWTRVRYVANLHQWSLGGKYKWRYNTNSEKRQFTSHLLYEPRLFTARGAIEWHLGWNLQPVTFN